MDRKTLELVADVLEALEKARRHMPIYRAVLKATGDRKQALDAVRYIDKLETEMGIDYDNSNLNTRRAS